MKITIECNSLEELREAVETLFVIMPEESEKPEKPEKKEKGKKGNRGNKIDRDEVASYMDKGLSYKEIAEIMGRGYSTICNIGREISEQ